MTYWTATVQSDLNLGLNLQKAYWINGTSVFAWRLQGLMDSDWFRYIRVVSEYNILILIKHHVKLQGSHLCSGSCDTLRDIICT